MLKDRDQISKYMFKQAKKIIKWCWATLPRRIVSFLIITGILLSSVWFLFLNPSPVEAGWWDEDWMFRKKITVQADQVDADLTNFILYVKIDNNSDFSSARSDGYDIRFTDNNGTILSYEKESWSGGDGSDVTADFWVKIPNIDDDYGAIIYIYYGNPSATNDTQSPEDTFSTSDNIQGAWLFNEGAGDKVHDSSGNDNTGTLIGNPQFVPGIHGTALDLDGVVDWVQLALSPSLDLRDKPFTVIVSFRPRGTADETIVKIGENSTNGLRHTLRLFYENTQAISLDISDRTISIRTTSAETIARNNWHTIGAVVHGLGGNINLYLDGIESTVVGTNTLGASTMAFDVGFIGASKTTEGGPIDSQIDHVIIYDKALTAEEIKFMYYNQNAGASGGDFELTWGDQEKGEGPILWLKFDEGYGTTAYDSTENDNDFTLSAASWLTDGKFGKAWDGDGSKYLSRADDSDFDFVAAEDFSISGWFKHDTISAVDFITAKHESGTAGGFKIYMDADGDIAFAIDDDGTWGPEDIIGDDQSKNYDDNTWHHFTAVKTGTTQIELFVDGILIDSDNSLTASGSLANAASIYIGIDADGSTGAFDGELDEIKIYPYARSTEQIKRDYNQGYAVRIGGEYKLPAGLVGHWDFDEGSGSTAYDRSGNGNDGTITDAAWKGSSDCKYGNCLSFDGDNDYVDVGEGDFVENIPEYSVSLWAKFANADAGKQYLSRKSGNFYLNREASETYRFYVYSAEGSALAYSDNAYADTKWHHIVGVYDGAEVQIYVDGLVGDSTPPALTGATPTNTSNLYFSTATSYDFNGLIDNVMIFNRALSQEEISDLYSAGRDMNATVGHWKLDEGQGVTAYDSSGNSNSGTLTNGPTWTTLGKFGKAVDFAGDDDFIDIGDMSADIKSVSLWVKPDAIDVTEQPLDLNGTGYVQIASGTVTGQGFTSPTIYINGISGASTVTTEWNHIVITTGTGIDANDVDIGRLNTTYFNGKIDEVKIYPYVLTSEQVKIDYNNSKAVRVGPTSPTIGKWCPPGFTGNCSPPIGEWKMDEREDGTCSGGTNDVCDTSSNSNDGAITGATWKGSSDCKYNSCLSFDGTGDYIETQVVDPRNWQGVTLVAWVNWQSIFNDEHTIIATSHAGYPTFSLKLEPDCGNCVEASLTDSVTNLNDEFTDLTLVDGVWYQVAMTYNASSGVLQAYLNGVGSVSPGPITGSGGWDSSTPYRVLTIGRRPEIDLEYFNGLIDNVMIFDYALTGEQISWLYNKGKPVGYWKFNEGEGANAGDSSENNNAGTLTGGTTWVSSGKYSSALDFAGDNDYVDIGDTSQTLVKAVSLWVKPDSVSVTEQPLDLNGAGYVQIANGTVTGQGFTSPTIYINGISGASTVTTEWNHILITTGTGINASDLDIGRLNTTYFDGKIDEVKIFNYELTAEQVKIDYNQGAALRFGD